MTDTIELEFNDDPDDKLVCVLPAYIVVLSTWKVFFGDEEDGLDDESI